MIFRILLLYNCHFYIPLPLDCPKPCADYYRSYIHVLEREKRITQREVVNEGKRTSGSLGSTNVSSMWQASWKVYSPCVSPLYSRCYTHTIQVLHIMESNSVTLWEMGEWEFFQWMMFTMVGNLLNVSNGAGSYLLCMFLTCTFNNWLEYYLTLQDKEIILLIPLIFRSKS